MGSIQATGELMNRAVWSEMTIRAPRRRYCGEFSESPLNTAMQASLPSECPRQFFFCKDLNSLHSVDLVVRRHIHTDKAGSGLTVSLFFLRYWKVSLY